MYERQMDKKKLLNNCSSPPKKKKGIQTISPTSLWHYYRWWHDVHEYIFSITMFRLNYLPDDVKYINRMRKYTNYNILITTYSVESRYRI